jgi:hypothetical protein
MNQKTHKITVGVLVLGCSVAVAEPAQIIVFERDLETSGEEISANFGVNRELGRAWIDVQIESMTPADDEPLRLVISRPIEGLSYDSDRKQVLYRVGGETIVCAEDASILWRTYLKSTGRCQLRTVSERRKADDGFMIRDRIMARVVFETQTPMAVEHAAALKK